MDDDTQQSYQALGLKAGASLDEVKQAYRDLVKVWHPDRFGHDERLRLIAQDKLKEINGAYKVLQASFFDAGTAPESSAPPEPEAATSSAPSSGRNRMMLWLALVALAFVAMAAFFFLRKDHANPLPPGNAANAANAVTNHFMAGINRYALSFHANQSYVAIATTGSLTGTFTLECWVLDRQAKDGTILSSCSPKNFGFDLRFRQGKRFHADIGDGQHWLFKTANAPFAYNGGIWYHLAYVVTPTRYTVYINGDRRHEAEIYPSGKPLLYDDRHQLLLGTDRTDSTWLTGDIAELRIWNTARTDKQIKANMNKTLNGDEAGLQGYWRFAEGAGTEILDASGHGFSGKLFGDVSWSTKVPPPWQ